MKLTAKKREKFLELLKEGTAVIHACTAISITPVSMYQRRRDEPDFAQAWAAAVEQGEKVILTKLEAEADRRAMEGYQKPVYHNGVLIGAERRYSDVLLIVRLKALAPEKYKERTEATVKTDLATGEQITEARQMVTTALAVPVETNGATNGSGNGATNGASKSDG